MIARLMGLDVVSPATLHRLMSSEHSAVFDVNQRGSWLAARVPGARHLHPESFVESELPADRAHSLVFYCSNPLCLKAPRAARRARKMGYGNVQVLSAGISGWVSAGLPTESGERT